FGGLAGVGIYVTYALVTHGPAELFWWEWIAALLLAVIFIAGAPLLIIGMFILYLLPVVFGKRYGVIGDADGILYRPRRFGRNRVLRWDEIRLFEVGYYFGVESLVIFRLYGPDTLVWWLKQAPTKSLSASVTKEAFGELHQALLDLIAART